MGHFAEEAGGGKICVHRCSVLQFGGGFHPSDAGAQLKKYAADISWGCFWRFGREKYLWVLQDLCGQCVLWNCQASGLLCYFFFSIIQGMLGSPLSITWLKGSYICEVYSLVYALSWY